MCPRHYREQYPAADQFRWQVADTFRPAISDDEDAELKVAHIDHMAGSWCSAGDAGRAKPEQLLE